MSPGESEPGPGLWSRPIPISIRPAAVVAYARAHRVGLILAAGVACRLLQYLAGRPAWLDEASLAGNIVGKSLPELFGPLTGTQLAPPGFLVVEWLATRLLGPTDWAMRLAPLAGGIGSLFLFERLARRCLGAEALWIALGLFAVSDDLIYFASELKPYSTDVAVALGVSLLGLALGNGTLGARRCLGFAAIGSAAVWFSYPALFVLAAAGVVPFVRSIRRREPGRAARLAAIGAAWLGSFALVYAVAREQLGHGDGMWRFWAASFPPSASGLANWAVRHVLYLFVNPLNFTTPAGWTLSAVPALLLFFLGCASLARRDAPTLASLLLPGGFALLAGATHLYPFHGRLVLFLVPYLLLLIAEGAARVLGRHPGRGTRVALLAVLFLFPTLDALYRVAVPRDRDGLNSYGDRRPPGLDPDHWPL